MPAMGNQSLASASMQVNFRPIFPSIESFSDKKLNITNTQGQTNWSTKLANTVRLRVCYSVFIDYSFNNLLCETILPWLCGDCKVGFVVPGYPVQYATLTRYAPLR